MTKKQIDKLKDKMSKLDDIGFIGTQEYISPEERAEINRRTAEVIREYHAAPNKEVFLKELRKRVKEENEAEAKLKNKNLKKPTKKRKRLCKS